MDAGGGLYAQERGSRGLRRNYRGRGDRSGIDPSGGGMVVSAGRGADRVRVVVFTEMLKVKLIHNA